MCLLPPSVTTSLSHVSKNYEIQCVARHLAYAIGVRRVHSTPRSTTHEKERLSLCLFILWKTVFLRKRFSFKVGSDFVNDPYVKTVLPLTHRK